MPIARIQILPYPEGNLVGAIVVTTSKDGAKSTESRVVSGSSDEASRTLYLEDGDKLTIDVALEKEHTYDKEQFAATMRAPVTDPKKKTPSEARGPSGVAGKPEERM
jgi:hypothetical protein